MKSFLRMVMTAALLAPALLSPVSARSQSAGELDALLDAPAVTYDTAARFVLAAADTDAPLEGDAAFRYAQERRWLPSWVTAGETARLGPLSLLIMQAFGLKGGLAYTFFPNAHYAYHELSSRRIIQDRADPELPVSGDWLFFMIGRVLAGSGEDLMEEAGDAFR
ncbi:MAG: hypothetical protein LBG57_09925 [Treponema sp.]|jgi:hypothetical protein|nr:hypothetical protein [Treponema sp.]